MYVRTYVCIYQYHVILGTNGNAGEEQGSAGVKKDNSIPQPRIKGGGGGGGGGKAGVLKVPAAGVLNVPVADRRVAALLAHLAVEFLESAL
jgi:hypothetical protein